MRRVVMLALLLYVIGATWTLTTRFVAARAGGAWPGSGVAQFAAVIQAASLVVSMWMGPMVLGVLPYDVWSLAALGLGSLAVVNVVLGLPALFAWRELYAGAFARQRVFFPAAGQ